MLAGVNVKLEDLITVSGAPGHVTAVGAARGATFVISMKSRVPGPSRPGRLECQLCSPSDQDGRFHHWNRAFSTLGVVIPNVRTALPGLGMDCSPSELLGGRPSPIEGALYGEPGLGHSQSDSFSIDSPSCWSGPTTSVRTGSEASITT